MSTESISAEKPKMTPLEKDWAGVLFSVRRSVRYHTRRRCFFERIGFFTKFLSVAFGGGTAVAALLKTHHRLAAIFGLFTAAFSSSDLIIGYAAKARLYHDLTRKFIELEKDMILIEKPTNENLLAITSRRLSIEADEPPKLSVLDLFCHNEVVRAIYGDRREAHIYFIPYWKGFFCHFHDFDRSDCVLKAPAKSSEPPPPPSSPTPQTSIPSRA